MLDINDLKQLYKYHQQRISNRQVPVKFYNFWHQHPKQQWFYRFLNHRKLLDKCSARNIAFFSVFGNKLAMRLDGSPIKIFYTGENVSQIAYALYRDHALEENIDLSLGFEPLDHPKYIRFPLWLLYMIPPESSADDIREFCKKMNKCNNDSRFHFASLIARHDENGIRSQILDQLLSIDYVHSAGSFRNNTSLLHTTFENNKAKFLKQFKFNICPENSDKRGYVTEKLFEAINAGCIPIYWGAELDPEPDILNHQAIIFWKKDEDNRSALEQIELLHSSPRAYLDFVQQPKLQSTAAEAIMYYMDNFERKVKELLR